MNQIAPAQVPEWTMADRLRKAREHAGMGIEQFGDAIGKSRQTVSNAESSKHDPQESTLRLWSLATGVSLHWLKTGEQPPEGPLAQLAELRTFNPKYASGATILAFPLTRSA